MAAGRLNREQFYSVLAGLDEDALRKALWTLYWRGSAPVQQRVIAVLDPAAAAGSSRAAAPADSRALLAEVTEFVALARSGAYFAGDRRVSPKQRTRWRFTFQQYEKAAVDGLTGRDIDGAATALTKLIDLASEMRSVNYFRSDDPIAAARFVVSDAAAALWSAIRREHGLVAFCEQASVQLPRWESAYGWTRYGTGWVAERETSLAEVVASLLPTADAWDEFADRYLHALDTLDDPQPGTGETKRPPRTRYDRLQLRGDLHVWHTMLNDRLDDGEHEAQLARLANHPALADSK